MRHWPSIAWGTFISWMAAGSAQAFTYEVLFDRTLAYDAVTLGRGARFDASAQSVLLDGRVKTAGTEAVTYDRLLINSLRVGQQFALSPNASARLTLPVVGTFEKQEGEQIPRKISEATWLEAKPRMEFIFATQNSLDLILGLNFYTISAYDVESKTENFKAKDHFGALNLSYPHLVVVKRGGRFDGGFSFQLDAERGRTVSKSTTLDESRLSFEDKVYSPTTIAIFTSLHQSFGDLYGEFAAIEASSGGNRIDNNIAIKEDYFRVQLGGMFPLLGKNLQLESNFLYKSLSYADNRNVTLDTIPSMALHLKLHVDYGIPLFAGIVGVRGTDGQSLQEFNADYRIIGFGGVAGVSLIL